MAKDLQCIQCMTEVNLHGANKGVNGGKFLEIMATKASADVAQ